MFISGFIQASHGTKDPLEELVESESDKQAEVGPEVVEGLQHVEAVHRGAGHCYGLVQADHNHSKLTPSQPSCKDHPAYYHPVDQPVDVGLPVISWSFLVLPSLAV